MLSQLLEGLRNSLSEHENMLFNNGVFSEERVKDQLDRHEVMQRLSGGRELSDQKHKKHGQFDAIEKQIKGWTEHPDVKDFAHDTQVKEILERYDKCLRQIKKLRGIVDNFQ